MKSIINNNDPESEAEGSVRERQVISGLMGKPTEDNSGELESEFGKMKFTIFPTC